MLGTPRRPWHDSESYNRRVERGRARMATRRRIFEQESACYLCGVAGSDEDVVDHIVPIVDGGTDRRSNMRRCCQGCHKAKSATEKPRVDR